MTRTHPLPSAPCSAARTSPRRRASARAVLTVVALSLGACAGLGACGSDAAKSPEETGQQAQAVAELRDFGLTEDQAECITDELGADTVVEASGMDILAAGQAYQDAAKACIK